MGKRLDLGSGGRAGWEGDEAVLLRQRVIGAGFCSRILSFFLSGCGWGFGNQEWGLAHHPASNLSHLTTWSRKAPKPSFPI